MKRGRKGNLKKSKKMFKIMEEKLKMWVGKRILKPRLVMTRKMNSQTFNRPNLTKSNLKNQKVRSSISTLISIGISLIPKSTMSINHWLKLVLSLMNLQANL